MEQIVEWIIVVLCACWILYREWIYQELKLRKEITPLSTEDVAERLQVSTATVRRLIKQRELKAIRVGRQFKVAPQFLDEYIRSH